MNTRYMVVDYIIDNEVIADDPDHIVDLCNIINKGWPMRAESKDKGLRISLCGYKYVSKEVTNGVTGVPSLEKHLGKLIIKVDSEPSTKLYSDAEYYIHATKDRNNGRVSVKHELMKYELLEMSLKEVYKCPQSFSIEQLEVDLEKYPERFISITFGTKDKIDHDSFQVVRIEDDILYIKQLDMNAIKPALKNPMLFYGIPKYDGNCVYFNLDI